MALPYFQENGHFVGETRYRQMLQFANPPLRPDEFEDQIRRSIAVEKLQGALTDWITVSDRDVDSEFKRRNEKVKLAVLNFPSEKFRETVSATDAEVAAEFESRKNDYRLPEKRKVKYGDGRHPGHQRADAGERRRTCSGTTTTTSSSTGRRNRSVRATSC